MLQHPDPQSSQDVDKNNQQRGNGITTDKFAGTVHGSVKVCFLGNGLPALPRFPFVNNSRIEIRIDTHLPARHRIQSKPGGDFRDAGGAFGDHDKINNDENGKDHNANCVISPDHKFAEHANDFTGGGGTLIPVHQNRPRRGDIQRKPE